MDDPNLKPQEEPLSQEVPAESPVEIIAKGADEAALNKDKYVRLLAEFDNMRKRHERERIDLIKYAHEEVIVECLKLYDDLERSLAAFKSKEGMDANLVKGLEMVFNNMKELMGKYEVKPIETKGKPFDPKPSWASGPAQSRAPASKTWTAKGAGRAATVRSSSQAPWPWPASLRASLTGPPCRV